MVACPLLSPLAFGFWACGKIQPFSAREKALRGPWRVDGLRSQTEVWCFPAFRGEGAPYRVRLAADLGICVNDSDHEPHDDPAPVVDPTCENGKGSL